MQPNSGTARMQNSDGYGPLAGEPERFAVRSRRLRDRAVVALVGELDHDSAPLLSEPLLAAVDSPEVALVVVDCALLSFCDSTGLNILLQARARAKETGTDLRLASLPGVASRMFEITGADTVFDLYPDLDRALDTA